jgi:glutathionyl-hydroquinone reductase
MEWRVCMMNPEVPVGSLVDGKWHTGDVAKTSSSGHFERDDPHYTGHVTVSVLWDKHQDTIVSNESADIIRMFNSAFEQSALVRLTIIREPCARTSMP